MCKWSFPVSVHAAVSTSQRVFCPCNIYISRNITTHISLNNDKCQGCWAWTPTGGGGGKSWRSPPPPPGKSRKYFTAIWGPFATFSPCVGLLLFFSLRGGLFWPLLGAFHGLDPPTLLLRAPMSAWGRGRVGANMCGQFDIPTSIRRNSTKYATDIYLFYNIIIFKKHTFYFNTNVIIWIKYDKFV